MKIEINVVHDLSQLKVTRYKWQLWTGPDGIDNYEGNADSLADCFEQITKVDFLNSFSYYEDVRYENPGEAIRGYLEVFTPRVQKTNQLS